MNAAILFKAALTLTVLALTGCNATMTQVKVPIPIVCQETEPERPIMPTEVLMRGADIDRFTQAAQAEIERREGYEIKLRTALQNCIKPNEP